jgi:hypothetical protein
VRRFRELLEDVDWKSAPTEFVHSETDKILRSHGHSNIHDVQDLWGPDNDPHLHWQKDSPEDDVGALENDLQSVGWKKDGQLDFQGSTRQHWKHPTGARLLHQRFDEPDDVLHGNHVEYVHPGQKSTIMCDPHTGESY